MALLRIPDEDRTLTDAGDIEAYLAERGIEYERMDPVGGATAELTSEQLLAAYAGRRSPRAFPHVTG